VVPGEARDASENGLVRPPRTAKDVSDRQGDGERDAGENTEEDDAEEGGDAQQELGPAHPVEPDRGGNVRQ
jgi:hypothetical protein